MRTELLIIFFITMGYLIEYDIDNTQYELFYDLETDTVTQWQPIKKEVIMPSLVKQHWVEWDNTHYENERFVTAFGR